MRIADLAPAARAEFLAICAGLNLSIPAISTSRRSVIDPEHGASHLAYCHRVIDTAAELGIGHVSIGLFGPLTDAQQRATWFWTQPGVRNPDDPAIYDLALTRIRDLADHAGGCDIQLSLEMYEDTYLGTARDAVRFMTDLDHPAARLNIDIGNLIRLHRPVEPWAEMIALCAPFAGYWHVRTTPGWRTAPPGQVMTHPAASGRHDQLAGRDLDGAGAWLRQPVSGRALRRRRPVGLRPEPRLHPRGSRGQGEGR
ncbi:MAG: TIM barrel protein [Defluviimonas denitrificans]